MAQIGPKIYYELSTGNVIQNTGQHQGDVVSTTEAQDFTMYTALQPYQQNSVGVIQLNFGDYAQNFAQYPYHIDITKSPPVIVWDTSNPIGSSLADVQKSKIAQLRDMYNQALASGVNVTVGTTSHSFACTADDIARMDGTQTAINKAFLSYPILYSDYQGSPVSIPDQATFDTVQAAVAKFANAQHQQILNLVGQAQSATTTAAVNAIQWTPATY